MKQQVNTNSVLSTNSERTKKINYKIGDPAKIIHILRNNLYSKPIQTCTQEYLCNARDAMREAGREDRPVEVSLPTRAECRLKIRDFGVGLSEERVQEVFTRYGNSTKDDSDEETGGFGLGAKSAWAYTDCFIVVSYLDGISRSYLAHTGDNSEGTLELMAEVATTEENGTEIQIALKSESDIAEFHQAVYRATLFWQVRPVLKGLLPTEIPDYYASLKPMLTGSGWLLFETNALGRLFQHKDKQNTGIVVTVDGVPYVLQRDCITDSMATLSNFIRGEGVLVLTVANGKVDVNASRETLADSEASKLCLNLVGRNVVSSIKDMLQEELAAFDKVPLFLARYFELNQNIVLDAIIPEATLELNGRSYCIKTDKRYHGERLRLVMRFDGVEKFEVEIFHFKRGRTKRLHVNSYSYDGDISLEYTGALLRQDRVIFLDEPKLSKIKIRKKLREYLSKKGHAGENQYCLIISPLGIGEEFDETPAIQAMLVALKEDIGITASSELTVLEDEVRARPSGPTDRIGLLCLYVFHYNHHNRYNQAKGLDKKNTHVKLEDLTSSPLRYLYIDIVGGKIQSTYDKRTVADMTSYLNQRGFIVCGINNRVKNCVKTLKNFTSFEDYMTRFRSENLFTKPETAYLKAVAFPKLSEALTLLLNELPSVAAIKDPRFRELLLEYKTACGTLQNTTNKCYYLLEAPAKHSPLASEISADTEAFNARIDEITKDYPLLDSIGDGYIPPKERSSRYFDKDSLPGYRSIATETVYYLNAKFKEAVFLGGKTVKTSGKDAVKDSIKEVS